MRLGAQVSAAGGVDRALERGAAVTAETVMVYTKSNRQWQAKPLTAGEIAAFQTAVDAFRGRVDPVVVHAAYLINVASPDDDLRRKSEAALRDEVERAEQLGVRLLVFHPGSHMGAGVEAGLQRVAEVLRRVIAETPGYAVRICLETMAGQGSNLGDRFEQLAFVLRAVDRPERLAVCLDTCHIFAAGYDIRTPAAYAATLDELDRTVGLDQIACFHFNDSKHPLGSRKDRHEHIGRGLIGLDGFASFVNDPRWADHPAHLETEKDGQDADGQDAEMDVVNLRVLRSLIRPV